MIKSLVQEERVPNIFRYSGEYWDETTNLQYLRARWYDPSAGRFITEDTYEGEIKNPLSLNLYTYVENNPLQYIDPTGNNKCAFTETAMECVGNGKGGGGSSAGNSYVGSTVVRGNVAPPPKITRASPKVKFEVSWNEAKSFNKLNIEKAMKPKVTGKSSSSKGLIGKDFEEFLTKQLGGNGSFSKGGRDFDGGIGNKWWEAKSGEYWNKIMDGKYGGVEKFKSDMGDRLRIAKENGASYELYSNSLIPQKIKDWLTKKGIGYTEWLN